MVLSVGGDGFDGREDGYVVETHGLASDPMERSDGGNRRARAQFPGLTGATHLPLERFGRGLRALPERIRRALQGPRPNDIGPQSPAPQEDPPTAKLREDEELLESYVSELRAMLEAKIPLGEAQIQMERRLLPQIVSMLNDTRPGIDLLTFDTMPDFVRFLEAWRNDSFHIRAIVNADNRPGTSLMAMDVRGRGPDEITIIAVDGDSTTRRANLITAPIYKSPARALVFCSHTERGPDTSSAITRAVYNGDQIFAHAELFDRYHDQLSAGTIDQQLGVQVTRDPRFRIVANGDLILPSSFMRYSGVPARLPTIVDLRQSVHKNAPLDVQMQDANEIQALIAENAADEGQPVGGIDRPRISFAETALRYVRERTAEHEAGQQDGPST